MTDQELRKLSRTSLLEMLVQQGRELEQVRSQLREARLELDSRRIETAKAGSIADAALALNRVFRAAQDAADQYLLNIEEKSCEADRLLEQTRFRCAEMETEAQNRCQAMLQAAGIEECEDRATDETDTDKEAETENEGKD